MLEPSLERIIPPDPVLLPPATDDLLGVRQFVPACLEVQGLPMGMSGGQRKSGLQDRVVGPTREAGGIGEAGYLKR